MPNAESKINSCVSAFGKKISELKKLLDKKEYGQYLRDLGLELQKIYETIGNPQDISQNFKDFIQKIIKAYKEEQNKASTKVTDEIPSLFEYQQLCEYKELKIDPANLQPIRVGVYAVQLMSEVDAPPQLQKENLKEAFEQIISVKESFDKYFKYFAKFIGICCAVISGALVFSGLMILILPLASLPIACTVSLIVALFSIKSNFSLFYDAVANFFLIATRQVSFLFSGVSRDKKDQLCKVAFWKRFLLLSSAWLTSFAVGATSLAYAASGIYPLIKIFLVWAAIGSPAVLPILTILAFTLATILCVGLTILMFVGFSNLLQKWENRENKEKKLLHVIADNIKNAWQNLKNITFSQVLNFIFLIVLALFTFHGIHFSVYSGMSVLNVVTHHSWFARVLGLSACAGEFPFNLIATQNLSKCICNIVKIAIQWLANPNLSHLFKKIFNPFQTCCKEISCIYHNTEKNIFYRSGEIFEYLFKNIIKAAIQSFKLLFKFSMKLTVLINAVGNGVTAATVAASNIPWSHPDMRVTMFETGIGSYAANLPVKRSRSSDQKKMDLIFRKICSEWEHVNFFTFSGNSRVEPAGVAEDFSQATRPS